MGGVRYRGQSAAARDPPYRGRSVRWDELMEDTIKQGGVVVGL